MEPGTKTENKKLAELSEKYADNTDKKEQIKEIQKRIDKRNKKRYIMKQAIYIIKFV